MFYLFIIRAHSHLAHLCLRNVVFHGTMEWVLWVTLLCIWSGFVDTLEFVWNFRNFNGMVASSMLVHALQTELCSGPSLQAAPDKVGRATPWVIMLVKPTGLWESNVIWHATDHLVWVPFWHINTTSTLEEHWWASINTVLSGWRPLVQLWIAAVVGLCVYERQYMFVWCWHGVIWLTVWVQCLNVWAQKSLPPHWPLNVFCAAWAQSGIG